MSALSLTQNIAKIMKKSEKKKTTTLNLLDEKLLSIATEDANPQSKWYLVNSGILSVELGEDREDIIKSVLYLSHLELVNVMGPWVDGQVVVIAK